MNTAGLFQRLRSLVPLPPVLVGTVLAHHTDDTSTVLIPGPGQTSFGGGVAIGSLIRPRGTHVPVGQKAFVRAGVIETRAPDVDPFPIVIGEVVLPPAPPPPPLPLGPWRVVGPSTSFGTPVTDFVYATAAQAAASRLVQWEIDYGGPGFCTVSSWHFTLTGTQVPPTDDELDAGGITSLGVQYLCNGGGQTGTVTRST